MYTGAEVRFVQRFTRQHLFVTARYGLNCAYPKDLNAQFWRSARLAPAGSSGSAFSRPEDDDHWETLVLFESLVVQVLFFDFKARKALAHPGLFSWRARPTATASR